MNKNSRKRNTFTAGGWRILVCAGALCIALLLGWLIDGLPSGITKIDVTDQRLYTISGTTKQLLGSLDSDVTILMVASEGSQDIYLRELIGRYEAQTPHIRFRYITSAEAAYYTSATLNANSLIVTNGEYDEILDASVLYHSEYQVSGYYQYLTDYLTCAENKLNQAIANITADLPMAYLLVGHNETEPAAGLQLLIGEAGMHVKSLVLSQLTAIPEDAAMIIINAPQLDITDNESALLSAYVAAGGSVFMVTDSKYGELANLSAFAAGAGLRWQRGVIMEADSGYLFNAEYPYYLMPETLPAEMTEQLAENVSRTLAAQAHGIRVKGASGYETTALLSTSVSSFLKADVYTDGVLTYVEGDEHGPFTVAAASRHTASGGGLFWLSSAQCLTDEINSMVNGANYALAADGLRWLHESTVQLIEEVPAVSLMVEASTYTPVAKTVFLIVLFAIPAAAVIAGTVIFAKSRKAKPLPGSDE